MMNCIECKTPNPEENRYCGKCGAELGRTLDETVRKRGFRDRQAIEMEILESVTDRVFKWINRISIVAGVIAALFVWVVGKDFGDLQSAVTAGKAQIDGAAVSGRSQINDAVQTSLRDIGSLQDQAESLDNQIKELRSQTDKYRQVNVQIAKVQEDLMKVKDEVVDLGKSKLEAGMLALAGPGPMTISSRELGCPTTVEPGAKVAWCPQNSPHGPILSQLSPSDQLRPVSSFSTVGFQDMSNSPKAACNSAKRGTFYVEKGSGDSPDRPFLCARKADADYAWLQLTVSQ
jgi:hypothetical protein